MTEIFPRLVDGVIVEDVSPPGLKSTITEAASSAVNSAVGIVSGLWGNVASNISVAYSQNGPNGYVYTGSSPPVTNSATAGLFQYFQGFSGSGSGSSGSGSGGSSMIPNNTGTSTGTNSTGSTSNIGSTSGLSTAATNAILNVFGMNPNHRRHHNNRSSIHGINVMLDDRIDAIEHELKAISTMAASLDKLLQLDNAALFQLCQFGYYMKLMADLDGHHADRDRGDDNNNGNYNNNTGSSYTTAATTTATTTAATTTAVPTRVILNQYCDRLSHSIDQIALEKQKFIARQMFKPLGAFQYLGRYSYSIATTAKQREESISAIEKALEQQTYKKQQLDTGRFQYRYLVSLHSIDTHSIPFKYYANIIKILFSFALFLSCVACTSLRFVSCSMCMYVCMYV